MTQIYSRMKVISFEPTVAALYKSVLPKSRRESTKAEQLSCDICGRVQTGVPCATASSFGESTVCAENRKTVVLLSSSTGWTWRCLGGRTTCLEHHHLPGVPPAWSTTCLEHHHCYLAAAPPPPEMPGRLKKLTSTTSIIC